MPNNWNVPKQFPIVSCEDDSDRLLYVKIDLSHLYVYDGHQINKSSDFELNKPIIKIAWKNIVRIKRKNIHDISIHFNQNTDLNNYPKMKFKFKCRFGSYYFLNEFFRQTLVNGVLRKVIYRPGNYYPF